MNHQESSSNALHDKPFQSDEPENFKTAHRQETTMTATSTERPSDLRLFADGMIWRWDDWLFTLEWIAHIGLDLPSEWTERAVYRDDDDPKIPNLRRFLRVAGECREAVRFNPPKHYDRLWTYQTIKGRSPLSVNADVRAFFEELTPGSHWFLSHTLMRHRGEDLEGPQLARVHPRLGVRFVVAGCDPSITR